MIGMQIRSERRELGYTQAELVDAVIAAAHDDGEAIALTVAAVSQWESGRHEPALRYRRHLARVLDRDQRTLFPNVGANEAA
jgi:transcriptional regulator with XRE-family HTH domain